MKNAISILLIIVAVVLFAAFTNPRYATVRSYSAEAARFDDALSKSKELAGRRDELIKQYNAIPTDEINKIDTLLPDSIDTVRLIIDVNALASRYGMSLGNIAIGSPDATRDNSAIGPSSERYGSMTLSFTIAATYDRFRAFLGDLERSLRLVDVSSMTFEEPKESGLTTYTVTVTTYWLK